MTVTADALDMLAGDPPRIRLPGDFHRHPTTGAPYVAHPTETNKDGTPRRVMYGRPSSFGAALDNPFNLLKWKERQLLIGASILEPDWRPVDPENRDSLDMLAAYCHQAAGSHIAADRGTHIHLVLQAYDEGAQLTNLIDQGTGLGLPSALQIKIIDQWHAFRMALGVTALAVEQTVVNDRWRLAGTLDRLDVADHDILTSFGVIEAGVPFVGDIKTGGLTLGNDGQPNYWVKYPVQLAAYVDAVPYDTDTDERHRPEHWPNPDVAIIYHYDLARAMAGEVVDWQAIPVNVQAGREGGDLCRAAADFGKRRDLFAMPAPKNEDRLAQAHGQPLLQGDAETSASPASSAPVPVPNRAVEQAAEPGEVMASQPPPVQAADVPWRRDRVVARLALLIAEHPNAEPMLRRHWPTDVPTLKHTGHTDDQLARILAAVRSVEAQVGATWHPDDAPGPSVRLAQKRALRAWEGRHPDECWFAASLIATFEQCRNPDVSLEVFVAQFTIEQAERLADAAQAATNHNPRSTEQ